MSREVISTALAPKPLAGYSQAIRANGFIFVSGQPPFDAGTGQLVGATIQEQTAQCIRNVQAVLRSAGSTLEKVVSATIIFDNEQDFPAINEEWQKWFPYSPPARQAAKLLVTPKGMKISVAAIAEA